jgi:hypothetical protein
MPAKILTKTGKLNSTKTRRLRRVTKSSAKRLAKALAKERAKILSVIEGESTNDLFWGAFAYEFGEAIEEQGSYSYLGQEIGASFQPDEDG